MDALQAFGREALKQGGVTAGCSWILDYYYTVVADPIVAETVLKSCLEKDDLMKLVKDGPGLGLVTSPETFLGTALGAQTNHKHPLKEALNKCFDVIAHRTVTPWLYSHIIFEMTPESKILKENTEKITTFIGPLISEKLNDYNKGISLKTMLQVMIENTGEEVPASQEYLREESMAVIVGATKPAPVAFSFIMVMLASHPDVQEKVYNEITEVLGDITRPVQPEDLPRLKYMEAVIKETIRLYPPVPVIARKVDKDLVLPDGKTLVEGVGVFIHIWSVHRNTKYWGADAEEFRPERFLEPLTHPAAFLGFSYGVRNCLGFQYAIMSLKTSITSVLRQFRVTSASKQTDRQKPLRVGVDLLLKHVDNFNVQLKSR